MVLGSEEKSKGCCVGWKEIRKMEVCAWAWRNGKMGLDCDGCWLREEDEVGCGVAMLVVLRRRGLLVMAKEMRCMRGLGEERMVIQGRRWKMKIWSGDGGSAQGGDGVGEAEMVMGRVCVR
ncbi:hypothetical protein AAC387_Pa06g2353 [Persea americana]